MIIYLIIYFIPLLHMLYLYIIILNTLRLYKNDIKLIFLFESRLLISSLS